ncbi:MAG: HAD-IA family hydrolase [Spirochaetales bacterium]|nr:HAD-IA family hydrolase [Spirochaetales bacterium]
MEHQQSIIPEFDTYLFDADGTLLNTVDLVTESYFHVFEVYQDLIPKGKTITRQDVAALMGIPLKAQMEQYFGVLSPDMMDRVCDEYSAYQLTIYADRLKLFPGVAQTLSALKESGKRTGIVTSRKLDTAGLYAEAMGIRPYLDIIVTPEDTDTHKPQPGPVLYAMERLQAEKETTVFVGDAVFDIQSGHRAGAATVFVGWSHNDPAGLDPSPDYVIGAMEELLSYRT